MEDILDFEHFAEFSQIKKEDIDFFEICSSTNEYLLNLAKEREFHIPHYAVAEQQTKGRGRMGRSFFSPSKTGVYFSYVLTPENGVQDPAMYTISACVAVCRAIEKLYGSDCRIKWVNDIYVNDRKVCGILTEGVVSEDGSCIKSVVVGIGINITKNEFLPEELENKAGGILDIKKENSITRAQLLATCIAELERTTILENSVYDYYSSRSWLQGKTVTVNPLAGDTKNYEARVKGITREYGLIVELPDGTEKILRTGEVSLNRQ